VAAWFFEFGTSTYSQPPAPWVPLLQVRFSVPVVPTVHLPVQVMLQVPLAQETFAPSPTVCVHCVPTQPTLQLAPHVPVQVAPAPQAKLQSVPAQVSKLQDELAGHEQLLPLQTLGPQAEKEKRARASERGARIFIAVSFWKK
jgi:hypothetical protein